MSYQNTYTNIINSLASLIYSKVSSKTSKYTVDSFFRQQTYYTGIQENSIISGKKNINVTINEYIKTGYTVPTELEIKNNLITFIKNSLGFSNAILEGRPSGSNMIAFVFAINYYLENTLTKAVYSSDGQGNTTTKILFKPITGGYKNIIDLHIEDDIVANIITDEDIDRMYLTLKEIGDANNVGMPIIIDSSISSSCSSSSSSSSCSSSSSSSSSIFIAYFNLG